MFFGQHDAQFVTDAEGLTISVYNNGLGRPDGEYSTVQLIEIPLDAGGSYLPPSNGAFEPVSAAWTYPAAPDYDFYSHNISGYTRLVGGHHLICEGAQGRFFELNNTGSLVWEYINPITSTGPMTQGDNPNQNAVFRAVSVPYLILDWKDETSMQVLPLNSTHCRWIAPLTLERCRLTKPFVLGPILRAHH